MLSINEVLRERYTIIRQLGKGGFGAVYEAQDNVLDARVALKEITLDLSGIGDNTKPQKEIQLAFEREAKILAKVNHEIIPHVKTYFWEEDRQYFVMELVDGNDLNELLKRRSGHPFPIKNTLEWTKQILDALDYLHTLPSPIIHRDIKPANLKLTRRNKIKLLDFGIAKGVKIQGVTTVVDQTMIAGSFNYSPIEQMIKLMQPGILYSLVSSHGERIEKYLAQKTDPTSDIYSLGATLYHLLTAEPPPDVLERILKILDGEPDLLKNPKDINPKLSDEISGVLVKSLEIDSKNRYISAKQMLKAINEAIENQPIAQDDDNIVVIKPVNDSPDKYETFVDDGKNKTDNLRSTQPDKTDAAEITIPINNFDSQPNETEPTGEMAESVVTLPSRERVPVPLNVPGEDEKTKSGSKYFGVLSVIGLFLLVFVGGAGLGFYFLNSYLNKDNSESFLPSNSNSEVINANITNSFETVTNIEEDANSSESEVDSTDVNSREQNTAKTTPIKKPTTQPQSKPTAISTPKVKTPTPRNRTPIRKTPTPTRRTPTPIKLTPRKLPSRKPTPKKRSRDCIYNGNC